MHRLLPPSQALQRARRRRDEVAVWRVRGRQPIGGWTFDGAPIAIGDPWPARDGVHSLACARFEAPADWPLAETRLSLDAGGESLLTITYDERRLPLGLDLNHTEFALDARGARLEIESVAKGPFGTPVAHPRLARAELTRIEPALDDFVRTLTLTIDLAAELDGHE